jgi:hypothetical protein
VLNAAAAASWALAAGCGAIIVLARLRPRSALYLLAATAPWLDPCWAVLQMPAARVLDAVVLSALVGCWRGPPAGSRRSPDLAHLLMLIVVVSAAARLAAVGAGLPLAYLLRDAVQYGGMFLTGAAHPFDIAGHVVTVTAGIGLFIATRRIIVDRPHTEQLTAALVIGGAAWAAAALAVYGLRSAFMDVSHHAYRDVVLTDPNAAGSYFAMLMFPAAALAIAGPHRRRWSGAAAALLGAMWLSWSSAAVIAAAGMLLAVILWTPRIARRTKAAITLVALLIATTQLGMRGGDNLGLSRDVRRDFVVTSVRMIGDEPLFGVGAGRYFDLSARYMPASLAAIYDYENAHNQFLQLAAELGLAGPLVFAVLVWRALRHPRAGATPMALGVTVFVLSAILGHPLLVPPVAALFWMAIATASPIGGEGARPRAAGRVWLIGTAALLVAYTAWFPARLRRELDRTVGTAAGVYGAEYELPLGRYRWSAARVALFPARESGQVRFALRRASGSTPLPTTTVVVRGVQKPHAVTLRQGEIYCVEDVPLETGLPFHRIDVWIDPVWYDAASLRRRPLGLQLIPADGWLTESCGP